MAGGVTLSVRQIGSYPLLEVADPAAVILAQQDGLGGPYATMTAETLVSTALASGSMAIGQPLPAGAAVGNLLTDSATLPTGGPLLWNAYYGPSYALTYLAGGLAALTGFNVAQGFVWEVAAPGIADQPAPDQVWTEVMTLSPNGALGLQGTLTVGRDPGAALEVATMGWVGRNTATSFNGRQGAVTLNGCDIYSALCLDSLLATENWTSAYVQASFQSFLANQPLVFGWNGRTGAVWLTLADISCVFMQPGQQPITQTPPPTSNDYSIANTAWVTQYVQSEFAGTGGLATQDWVLANTVNTFNGRSGIVLLSTADITGAGGAPINSPQFTGVPQAPTAAPGQATGQIATTLFVQNAIVENTTGVVSFNTRTGAVSLTATDINNAGGALLASPAFTGTPTAPTAAVGTNNTELATTAFVLQEVAAIGAGVLSFNGRSGVVTLALADIEGAGGAPLASPAFTGTPTVPTPASPIAATTTIANTNWVVQYNSLNTVASFNGRIGAVTLSAADVSGAGGLTNPSVALTGTPTAPTQLPTDNSTAIATTAYVHAALTNFAGVTSFNTRTGAVSLTAADVTGAGGALLASPIFTGVPAGPTASPGTSTTQLATTAFVAAALAAGVTSFNTRTGAVVLTLADVTGVGGAPLANPTFTGVPAAPTAAPGSSTTQLATTAFVTAAIGGIATGVTSFNTRTGAVTLVAADINGLAALSLPAGSSATRNFTIQGVTDGSAAAAGYVGEYILGTANPQNWTPGTPVSCGSINLTAGDWNVWGTADCAAQTGATVTLFAAAIGLTLNSMTPIVAGITTTQLQGISLAPGGSLGVAISPGRISLTTTTTLYLTVNGASSGGQVTNTGYLAARRVR